MTLFLLLSFTFGGTEICPINVFYGGKFTSLNFLSTLQVNSFMECLIACRDDASCYSTNFDDSTNTCYLNPHNSTSSDVTRGPKNWIATEVDRGK